MCIFIIFLLYYKNLPCHLLHYRVVLVKSIGGLAFGLQHADYPDRPALILMYLPTGSSPGLKNCWSTVWPIRHTLAACNTSCPVKGTPSARPGKNRRKMPTLLIDRQESAFEIARLRHRKELGMVPPLKTELDQVYLPVSGLFPGRLPEQLKELPRPQMPGAG